MITHRDTEILRGLAYRVTDITATPEMQTRRNRWRNFNDLKPERPMVVCFPEGAWWELVTEGDLFCEDKQLREWERIMRQRIFIWENFKDDNVFEPWLQFNWDIKMGDYGYPVKLKWLRDRGNSYTWIPPITDLAAQVDNLHIRNISVDKESTYKKVELANSIFGDILPAKITCMVNAFSMIKEAMFLVGLDELMFLMYDEPEALHKLMAIMRDDQINKLKFYETEGLLTSDNQDEYVGSGGFAYTSQLPTKQPGEKYLLKDIWGFTEAQETVGISPEMFNEFIFPYQKEVLELTGMNHYGCCEPIHDRLDDLLTISNMRRFSVSPWCNQEVVAAKLKNNYIISRKPNPSPLCIQFNENALREDIRSTLNAAPNGVIEFIMKDTHTVENDKSRFGRWVELAFDEINKFMG